MKSLLNNKLYRKGGFDFGFRPHVGPRSREKMGTSFSYGAFKDGRRREKVQTGLIHAYRAFTSPSNAIDIQSEFK